MTKVVFYEAALCFFKITDDIEKVVFPEPLGREFRQYRLEQPLETPG
jgi:hypothetical protein